jgi:hypothetical protein
MKATNPATQAQRRYLLEFTLAIVAYMAVLVGTRYFFRNVIGPLETVLALLPMVPVIFVFIAVLRFLAGTDEFQRRIVVDSLAIAGGATALIALTYGFVEGDPLPRPSAFWTWTVFMVLWLISSFVLRLRYR